MLNTLVHKPLIHKGSQWVVFMATLQYGPLETHEFVYSIHMGVMENPLKLSELDYVGQWFISL